MDSVALRFIYDGVGPVVWNGGPTDFGLEDKNDLLMQGKKISGHEFVFDFQLQVKTGKEGQPIFLGDFCHGSPKDRFLYLSWRSLQGHYAQRFLLPLTNISSAHVALAQESGVPLVGVLTDHQPKATSTGVNIGGRRSVEWTLAVNEEAMK